MPGVGSWFRMRSPLQELEENKPATTTQKERIGITATGEYIVESSLLLVSRGNHYDSRRRVFRRAAVVDPRLLTSSSAARWMELPPWIELKWW